VAVVLVEGVIQGITATLPQLFEVVTNTIIEVLTIVVENLPSIIDAVM